MLNLDVIEKLIAAHDAAPVRVNAAACLNAKHKARKCRECLVCPTDAIRLNGAHVAPDAARCVECGLCASVCPTAVFTVQESAVALLDAVAPYAHIEFACPHKPDLGTTRAPHVEGVQSVKCLARLSSELLVALAAEHAHVWLDDSPCAKCPIGARAHPYILAARDAAKRLLAAWHRDDTLRCYTDPDAGLSAYARRVPRVRAKNQALSRREFFSFFTRNAGYVVSTAVATALGNPPEASPSAAESVEHPLARALTKLGTPQTEHIASERLATIQVAASCTACGVCAKICPTRAMQFRTDARYYVLAVQPHTCLGTACNLCQLICPVDALTLTAGVAASALATREPQTLRSGALTVCSRCYASFAMEPGQVLCPICRASERRQHSLALDLFQQDAFARRETAETLTQPKPDLDEV